ncbi:MAG: hypothetical protein ACT4QF_21515 [Sporichthyaceae bacterium]
MLGVCSLVSGDRLWDHLGREWFRDVSHADDHTADSHFGSIRPVGVIRPDGLLRWVTEPEARDFWDDVREHYLGPGDTQAPVNDRGQTFTGHVWRSGKDRLFTLQVHA